MLKSIRAKLQLMLLLLIIIVSLMFVNYLMNRAVFKWEHTYAEVIRMTNHFAENMAQEIASLKDSEKFFALKNSYTTLYQSCLNCHESNPGDLLLSRNSLLDELHNNKYAGTIHRQTVNEHLTELIESVRDIHEHHIATLKKFLAQNQPQIDAYQENGLRKKSSTHSAPELDIIQQTVAIQHSLANITRMFYILEDTKTPGNLQNDFSDNMSLFYKAVNTFESYSLDAQDGLLVEELLDSGRTFENSYAKLVQLKALERKAFAQLNGNQKEITTMLSLVRGKVKNQQFPERAQTT